MSMKSIKIVVKNTASNELVTSRLLLASWLVHLDAVNSIHLQQSLLSYPTTGVSSREPILTVPFGGELANLRVVCTWQK